MKKLQDIIVAGIIPMLLASCGGYQDPLGTSGPGAPQSVKEMVASGAVLDSAHLFLHVRHGGGELVIVHPVEQPWLESSVTWNDVGPWVSPFVINTFTALDTGVIKVDVSTLVNGWLVGTRINNGILLDQNPPDIQRTQFDSRERGAVPCPKLKLYLTDGASSMVWTLHTTGDTYVDENHPDVNQGSDTALYSGYDAGMPGEFRTMLNFDLSAPQAPGSVGDRVWNDADGNGIQDAGEAGMPNVTVNLLDCFDTPIATTVTDADGMYLFGALPNGAYRMEVVLPAGCQFSPRGAGSDSSLDSDFDPVTGGTECFAVVEGVDDLSRDAGLVVPAPAETGCTHGLGYWKNHAGFGKQEDKVSSFLPIWLGTAGGATSLEVASSDQVVQVLQMMVYGHPSNGITKLYARLLTAKLNLASGAYSPEADALVQEIDAYLADTGWNDWDGLSNEDAQNIAAWRTELQRYNGGELGPGSCDESDGE